MGYNPYILSSKIGRQWVNEDFISFYKQRYLHFLKIGIGNYTEYDTKVTNTLIKATANRLDQLIKGEITDKNRNRGDGRIYLPPKIFNSNRSFGWNHTSQFRYSDLDLKQQHSINCPTEITETYIDKYTTAYRSEIMQKIMSQKGL